MDHQIDPFYKTMAYGLLLAIASILWVKWRQNHWTRKGIYQVKPDFFFGNVKDFFFCKKAFGDSFNEIYKEIKLKGGKHGGFYAFLSPVYMPVDPVIIQQIVSKDFESFMNHGVYYDEKREPLSGNIFSLEGEKWRKLRAKLTPLFTSGKIKQLYNTFLLCSNRLTEILSSKASQKELVDAKSISERYAIDIIGNCIFGVDCNSTVDPSSDFVTYGRKIFERDFITSVSRIATNVFPKIICQLLHVKLIQSDVSRFFMDTIKEIVSSREKNNLFRQDFMHLLLQLKNQGKVTNGETILSTNSQKSEGLTLNELAAQCFNFFFAGFETSATTMTFALFELAINPDIQDKLRSEIQLHGNSFEDIKDMVYLDKVIYETLRKHPPITGTSRRCNRSYKIPGSNVILKKGSLVHIPIIGIHRDPDYYPEPDKFDPERFDEATKATRSPYTWLPFGKGPRTCIGLRFGMIQTKIGLATVINNFRVSLSDKTRLPLEMDPFNFVYSTKDKIWLNLEKI